MIVVGLISNATDVTLAGGDWAVLGLIPTFVGFRLRVSPSRKVRP
jgi:hypothetical protein